MSKAVTEKDVRYAVEYGGQRLVRSYDQNRRPAVQFHLMPSGLRVPPAVANTIPQTGVEGHDEP